MFPNNQFKFDFVVIKYILLLITVQHCVYLFMNV